MQITCTKEFTDWAEGEPTVGGTNQNCGQFWKERNYKWDDAGCQNVKNYVCKKLPIGRVIFLK